MSDNDNSNDSFFKEDDDNSHEEEIEIEDDDDKDEEMDDDINDSDEDDMDDMDDSDDDAEVDGEKEVKKVLGETKPLSDSKVKEYNDRIRRSGLIYLSSIPPFMKPQKLKFLLGKYGSVGRMHLVQEDHSKSRRRMLNGGSRKTKFTEGWVEFDDKVDAKRCVSMMNGQIIGGKKSGFFHDIIWTMKYLNGFKWNHLSEKIMFEKRLRGDRLKSEFAKARKADERFLENVGHAEKNEMIQKKRKEKKEKKSS